MLRVNLLIQKPLQQTPNREEPWASEEIALGRTKSLEERRFSFNKKQISQVKTKQVFEGVIFFSLLTFTALHNPTLLSLDLTLLGADNEVHMDTDST